MPLAPSQSHTFHETQTHPPSIVMFWSCAQQFLNYLAEVLSPWPPWECSGPLWRIGESITLYSCLPAVKSFILWTLSPLQSMESRPDLDSWSRTKKWTLSYFLKIVYLFISHSGCSFPFLLSSQPLSAFPSVPTPQPTPPWFPFRKRAGFPWVSIKHHILTCSKTKHLPYIKAGQGNPLLSSRVPKAC